MDKAVEGLAKGCVSCQSVKHSPGSLTTVGLARPAMEACASRFCMTFFQGFMYLVAVDAHSKWPEVHALKETSAATTINRSSEDSGGVQG